MWHSWSAELCYQSNHSLFVVKVLQHISMFVVLFISYMLSDFALCVVDSLICCERTKGSRDLFITPTCWWLCVHTLAKCVLWCVFICMHSRFCTYCWQASVLWCEDEKDKGSTGNRKVERVTLRWFTMVPCHIWPHLRCLWVFHSVRSRQKCNL